jgi:sarcosine oxidase, subunit alpha
MSGHRLAPPVGARLNREREISFVFNRRSFTGFQGDTLASALLANGVQLVGRSFKLHRPRGIYSCGIEEPNAIVDVIQRGSRTPNVRASVVEISPGLVAESVNCWPSLRFDVGAVNNWFSAALPAGFYYKTFKWPNWHVFEPSIRRLAGLGRAPREVDRDRYEEINVQADVLVIGAGPSGLSAAIAATEAGARVLLLSSSADLGGASGWLADPATRSLLMQARQLGIRILTRTVAFGLFDHNLIAARQEVPLSQEEGASDEGRLRERLWKIRARVIIAATGAFERPMIFPDNDRPGVMLAGAVEKYARAYGVACGNRVVVATNSDDGYRVARSLMQIGIEIVAVADSRPESLVDADAVSGIPTFKLRFDSGISSVQGTTAVRGCTLASIDFTVSTDEHLACDLILSAGGFAPAVHLHSQAGGTLRWLTDSAMFVPDGTTASVNSVGACAGVFKRELAIEHAAQVGAAVARGHTIPQAPVGGAGRSLASTHVPRVGSKQFVDFQNDVTADDIALAARENYRSVEHLKRYTTTGMGTDQGKTSNINALVLMGKHTDRAPAAVGTTKFRPPFVPITLGLFAGRRTGRLYRPLKRLPGEAWHEARGAAFEEYGGWWRPAAYPQFGESIETAAHREVTATRNRAGIFDGSPLGKLEVFGLDAARFLDLMYVGTLSTLSIGQARYGVVLNENGILVDDGIVARLGPERFWVNTSSAGAERTAAAFEEWLQCEFVGLKVLITPTTSRWANVTVAGPRAWQWLSATGFDDELAPSTMPHMSIRQSRFDDIPIRVLRASFSGELGYEINVPAGHAKRVLSCLWEKASQFGAVPYGVEALQIMRIEKGYIHIGTDTDGTTIPQDIGLAKAIERKTANFVGRRSLSRPVALDQNRLQLVGLIPTDRCSVIPVGAHIASFPPPTRAEGHVTSSVMSRQLGHPIALAMLARGATRLGERIRLHHLKTTLEADVVKLPFVDPLGKRLNAQ